MIQELKFKNFLSFRDEAIFSFEPSKDEPINRVATMADGTKLLRFAVVFGANASGKSNFLEALDFLEEKILAAVKEFDPAALVLTEGSAALKNAAAANPLLRMFVTDSLIASFAQPVSDKVNEYLDGAGREKLREKLAAELSAMEARTPADLVGGKERWQGWCAMRMST